jgi:long-chain acyl-CoA synthetase
MTTIAEEPAARLDTIADLPFLVAGRYPRALMVGRCTSSGIQGDSTQDWFDRVRDVSLGLRALGVRAGDRVVIMSESRPEWLLADLAILTAGAVTVPIYPTLSAHQARYIVQDSGASVAIVSSADQLAKLQSVRHELPRLEAIAVFDSVPPGAASVFPFAEIASRGHARIVAEWGAARTFRDEARAVPREALATIIYTSGTTGEPKGVMLSHANLVENLKASHAVLPVGAEDVALSFLPLSHSFERLVSYLHLYAGVTIVFAESMETIRRDMQLVRPTIMTGVPRVYEKFKANILAGGAALPQPRRALFRWATRVAAARGAAETNGRAAGPLVSAQAAIAERLVFSKIRSSVGGRLRCLVSGSAPLSVEVAEFFHGVGLPITEGYGLTETAPVLTVNPQGAARAGTVGRAIPGVDIKIAEDGEILARGPNIMIGYYNKPEATAEALRDGWLHTGDVGVLDAKGYLRITDRKKDLLVTSGGKNIAPQPIEAILKRNPLVAEAVVMGDRRRFVSALIVPDFAVLQRRLQDLGRPPGERADLVGRADVVALYKEIVDGMNQDLAHYERIKKIRLLPREFSIQSGELTPTLKVKRKVVEQNWRDEIEQIYAEQH